MRKVVKVSAPAKLILSGEHAVVYGNPAILVAIGKRLTAERCQNGRIKITSEIPIGAGMGSSAAFSVATSAVKLGEMNLEKINDLAYKMEKKFHGNPSGADNTICTYGGFLWYRKENENFKTFKTIIPKRKFPKVYLINTGKPLESTKEMVQGVGDRFLNRKAYLDIVLKNTEKVTKQFLEFLIGYSDMEFGEIIKENERLIEQLGVVSESTREIIRKIEKIGGAAKICGAGGRKDKSGIVLVYHKDTEKLMDFAKKNTLDPFLVKMGIEGVQIE
jgi:mevalonate kinase